MATSLPGCGIEVPETVHTQPEWLQAHATWLYRALLAGSLADAADGEVYPVVAHDLGRIELADGALIACDPYWGGQLGAPFTQRLPVGGHEVVAAVATIEEGHVRTAAALLITGAGPVTRWSLGLTGEAGEPSAFGEVVGYAVDTGSGAFLSPAALEAMSEVLDADAGMLEDPLSELLESELECGVGAPRDGALPVAVFHTGWGDGLYPTWFGHAADGTVAVAMTDFLLAADPWQPDSDPDDPDDPDDSDDSDDDPEPPKRGFFGRLFGRG